MNNLCKSKVAQAVSPASPLGASRPKARAALILLLTATLQAQTYDLLIRNGRIADGTGDASFIGDLAIQNGKIAALGFLPKATAKRTLDAKGLVVAPGFIDMHNHSDDSLLDEPKCESMIRQGVTTMVLGEGASQGPVRPDSRKAASPWTTLGGYFDYVEKKHAATNICSYVGETQVWTRIARIEVRAIEPGCDYTRVGEVCQR